MLFFRVKPQEMVDFAKHLSVMLKSGITIDEAIGELGEQTQSRRFQKILLAVRSDVEKGLPLSQAFERHPRAFGDIVISVTKAGEASGTLEENLSFLASWLEHNNDIRKEVHGAMLYPAIVFAASILLSSALALLVLPRLLPIFAQFSSELPLPTRLLLAFTNFLQGYWFVAGIGVVVFIVGFNFLNRLPPFRRVIDWLILATPFFGSLIKQYQLTLIGQLLGTLFKSGLSIFEILNITAEGATNLVYREALRDVSAHVSRGKPLADALRSYPKLFPRNMLSMIAIGEKSGTLEESFTYVTEYYRKEVHAATKRLPTVIEPLLLLFMGCIVALVALSIIMPIYQFTANVRGS